jgi:Amt family ammonium transporter
LGGVSFVSQLAGSLLAIVYALVTGFAVYKAIDAVSGFRLDEEQEFVGADLSVHSINAYPEENVK